MTIENGLLVALILGLTQVAKMAGIESRFLPVVAIALGLVLTFGAKFLGVELGEVFITGIIAALSAMGLYSGSRAVTGK